MISFTSEEAWRHVPGKRAESVFLAGLPAAEPSLANDSLEEEFAVLRTLRETVNLSLEQKRVAKEIGKATEAEVVLTVPPGMARETWDDKVLEIERHLLALEGASPAPGDEAPREVSA